MRKATKTLLLLGVSGALLSGCATYYDPAYDNRYYDGRYAYSDGSYPQYRYYEPAPGYYYPRTYVAPPSVSFGFGYSSGWRHH